MIGALISLYRVDYWVDLLSDPVHPRRNRTEHRAGGRNRDRGYLRTVLAAQYATSGREWQAVPVSWILNEPR